MQQFMGSKESDLRRNNSKCLKTTILCVCAGVSVCAHGDRGGGEVLLTIRVFYSEPRERSCEELKSKGFDIASSLPEIAERERGKYKSKCKGYQSCKTSLGMASLWK